MDSINKINEILRDNLHNLCLFQSSSAWFLVQPAEARDKPRPQTLNQIPHEFYDNPYGEENW